MNVSCTAVSPERIALNINGKREAKSGLSATSTFITTGEVFADGAMIELISGSSAPNRPDLLLRNGRKTTVGPRVEYGGRIYEAPLLPMSLYRATRFPSESSNYGSDRALFGEIRASLHSYLDWPESPSGLGACFVMSTWLADRLPLAPTLTMSGPDEDAGIAALILLSCLCRYPLMLAELTPAAFRSLPMQLPLSLLLDQQQLRPNMQRLLRASRHRGLYFPGTRGTLVDVYGSKAIFCGNDFAVDILSGGVIQISLPPSQLPSAFDPKVQNEIARYFQPRLLMYRLKNLQKIGAAPVDVSQLTFATRQLCHTLAMCFPGDSELARDTVQLLGRQDEDARLQHTNSVECAIIEVLLEFIHERKLTEMTVGDLADLANALLQSRGEILEYSAEEVGWKLKGLSLHRHRTGSGSHIEFNRQTSCQVHRLAHVYGLGSSYIETCSECANV